MLLYQAYAAQQALLEPWRRLADAARPFAKQPWPISAALPFLDYLGAAFELISETKLRHERPDFGIDHVVISGEPVAVEEVVVHATPFCRAIHFRKAQPVPAPRVLLVAPMSGHFATLLRGTVAALLPDHDLYVTDWLNARNISLAEGRFDLDDYIDHMIEFVHLLGSPLHVIAVCQPAVPVLAATSIMAAAGDVMAPRSITLMGGPIDPRANPTKVNEFAEKHSLAYLERTVITQVPMPYAGFMRRVFPGFLQIGNFVGMNLDRHIRAHAEMFRNLVKGNGDDAAATRRFYDEYLTVTDMTAEFYLQTVDTVFKQHLLPRGLMTSRGRPIEPRAVTRTALMTVEGAEDDICAPGQTYAAHILCSSLDASRRAHHLQPGVGHYGVFNGRRWREEIMPRIRDFIRAQD
ncbi:MAG TPA: polyhydroxyalkanoate depolymerase [Alphaproteobacteria bacterium]|nr:polyhydroxyalkanoate depolymerase [Alphaproteobacteria bacterium]